MQNYLSKLLTCLVFLFSIILIASTPNAIAEQADHVVISEVQVGITGDPTNEFIELYNPTASNIDLTNWKLTKKTASGTESDLVSTLSGIIKSHGYFLIAHPTGYTGSILADQVYSQDNSISGDNTILLYAENGRTLIDKLGFTGASDFEGSTETSPGSGQSRERRANETATNMSMAMGGTDEFNGNGEDSDNNANDFVSRSIPQPQNSQSSLEPFPTQTPTDTPTETPSPTEKPINTPTVTQAPTDIPTQTPSPAEAITPAPPVFEFPLYSVVCTQKLKIYKILNIEFQFIFPSCKVDKL